jgi:hypothetical protein
MPENDTLNFINHYKKSIEKNSENRERVSWLEVLMLAQTKDLDGQNLLSSA